MLKEIFTKKENQFMIGLAVVSILCILFSFYFFVSRIEDQNKPRVIPNSLSEIVWQKYSNKKYNFSVEYPEHFLSFEKDKESELGPMFNFYFDFNQESLPISPSANESHFSIYPQGFPAGGVNLYSIDSEFKNKNNIEFNIKEFKTYSGKTWAIIAFPQNMPQNWNSAGFIWISSSIENLNFRCFDNDTEIEKDICDPYAGHRLYPEGNINNDIIESGKEFLNRINFSK